ncbi:MAG: hypothetical protein RLZZ627_1985 [Pseudomonadota bacterium]|jgi:hypothetical protein
MRSVLLSSTLSFVLMMVLSGCVWVDLNAKGEAVKVLTPAEASRCKRIGHVESNTTADIVGIPRDDESLNNELTRLARNHAGELGGNAVVAIGKPQNGQQSFNVYRCQGPTAR